MSILKIVFYLSSFCLIILSCNSSSTDKNLKSGTKDIIGQTKPALMVFPSDALLKRINCLTEVDNQGTLGYIRDYKKSFTTDSELKLIIASIEELFAKNGYPIENLEQQLKQIETENAIDDMESIAKDPKTLLMNTARPDFIIEIDYEAKQDPSSRNPHTLINYLITAIDVYSNKTVASITQTDLSNSENKSIAGIIKGNLDVKMDDFQQQLGNRFADINSNGAEITLRITVDGNTNLKLGDECLGTENYNDWINNWLKTNTVNQTFKPVKNTDMELRYTNVRIKAQATDGKKFTAYDFANKLKNDISKGCGIIVTNKTQGIGDAYVTVKSLK